jgi:hypothetical protein
MGQELTLILGTGQGSSPNFEPKTATVGVETVEGIAVFNRADFLVSDELQSLISEESMDEVNRFHMRSCIPKFYLITEDPQPCFRRTNRKNREHGQGDGRCHATRCSSAKGCRSRNSRTSMAPRTLWHRGQVPGVAAGVALAEWFRVSGVRRRPALCRQPGRSRTLSA